jgi:hypothetical protein
LWCDGGTSLYDVMGRSLRCLGLIAAADVAALEAAARKRGLPLKVLEVERPATAICDGSGLVLSPPDQHVAWRGDRPPSDPLALIDHVRGVVN